MKEGCSLSAIESGLHLHALSESLLGPLHFLPREHVALAMTVSGNVYRERTLCQGCLHVLFYPYKELTRQVLCLNPF